MPSWSVFVQHFGAEELVAVLLTVACIVFANEGVSLWRFLKRKKEKR